jgi:hypothetical protein
VVCSGPNAYEHENALNSSPTLPFLTSAHIKLIGLRVDTLHVATDPTFIAFTPFTLEIYLAR